MTDGLEEYLTYLRAKGYAAGTIRWQRSHLLRFTAYLRRSEVEAWIAVNEETIRGYLALLNKRGLAARTRRASLSALKGFFSYLCRMGIIPADPAAAVEQPRGESSLPRLLTGEEVLQILAAPDLHTPVGVRDRAILELLYSSGVRRQELAGLNVGDADLERGYLRVNQGKNRKDRVVPVGDTACKFIEAYLKLVRWWFLRNPAETALFLDSQKGKRMSGKTLEYLVKKYAKKSRLAKKASPHTLRHSMAAHLLKNEADIRHIQLMLGHASVATTEVYTRLVIDDLKEIHKKAHPRGRR